MSEALRLADWLEPRAESIEQVKAAAELRRLAAVEQELGALKRAISEAEPVAWKHDCAVLLTNDIELWIDACPHCGKPRTHAAQQAKPQPLSDEQIDDIQFKHQDLINGFQWLAFAREIEDAHGIKG